MRGLGDEGTWWLGEWWLGEWWLGDEVNFMGFRIIKKQNGYRIIQIPNQNSQVLSQVWYSLSLVFLIRPEKLKSFFRLIIRILIIIYINLDFARLDKSRLYFELARFDMNRLYIYIYLDCARFDKNRLFI